MKKVKDDFYENLLMQATKLGGLARVTRIEEGVVLVGLEDNIPKPEFDKLCEEFKVGETAIVMDIDTAQFFTQSDWTKLKAAGARTISIAPEPK